MPAALLAGCFAPDYEDGGFSCEDKVCPDGYECVGEGMKRICKPTDKVGVMRKPHTMPPCGQSLPVTDKLVGLDRLQAKPGIPHLYALVLDSLGQPVLFFADKAGNINHAEFYGDKFKVDKVPGARGDMVAAASSGDRAVVAWVFREDTNTQPSFNSFDFGLPRAKWGNEQEVSVLKDMIVTSLDMDGRGGHIYLAVTTRVGTDFGGQVLKYNGKDFTKACSVDTSQNQYVGARVGVSGSSMAWSVFRNALIPANSKWFIKWKKDHGTGKCSEQTTLGIKGFTWRTPLPGPVAPDEIDNVHLAMPLPWAATDVDLGYRVWEPVQDSPPKPVKQWDESIVVSTSVDLALIPKGNQDVVISYRHSKPSHTVLVQRGKDKSWSTLKPGPVEGHSTRVAVDKKGTVHLLYDESTQANPGSAVLRYHCFK